jgi:hypothetical protein
MNLLWILDYNLVFQESTVLTASSEDPEFPASNLKDIGALLRLAHAGRRRHLCHHDLEK